MAIKFNPLSGTFDFVVENADKTKYDNTTSGLTATNVQDAIDEIDGNLDGHLDGGVSKHDATEIDYERVDGSKKNIQAASDEVESALSDLDDAIGALDATPTNYTPVSPAIVASHLTSIDSEIGNILSTINNFDWQPAVIDKDITAQPGAPTAGDRYLLGLDTAASIVTGAAWAGHDGEIAEWDGTVWVFTLASAGTYVDAIDESDGIYLFGGVTWVKKFFEATTASGFLSKSGFDIQLTALTSQNVIVGNGSNVATSLDSSSVGDILANSTTGFTIKAGVIVDADINATAAIAVSKLAALTINRAIISDGSGFLAVSAVTNTELGQLTGISSNVQTQIDGKEALWVNTPLAGNTTAADHLRYLVDTGSARIITLPAASNNFTFIVKDVTGSAFANNITIARDAAEDIEGVAADFLIDSSLSSTTFVSDGTDWWIV